MLRLFYTNVVFKHTNSVLTLVFLSLVFLGFYATKLEIDASAQTLLLEDDKDLKFSRLIAKRYKSKDILVITYTPKGGLLSTKSLETLKNISLDLEKLALVDSTLSILNVPLLQSPVMPISELINNVKTLESIDTNQTLAKQEFLNSPLYKNNLVSNDFTTSAILINLKTDKKFIALIGKIKVLKDKEANRSITKNEKEDLINTTVLLKEHRDAQRVLNHQNILEIRSIINKYKNDSSMFLGGVNMIADDIVSFVKNDLSTYGSALIIMLGIVLFIIFKKIIWIVLPLGICLLSVVATSGALAFFSWEITVISSNFIAMQLIITLSIVLHLIVRYKELCSKYTKSSQQRLILNTMLSKANPTFFAIITTIAGFTSLIFSNIQPVINLGFMMSVGIFLSLIISFLVFPAILVKIPKFNKEVKTNTIGFSITNISANIVLNHQKSIFFSTIILILLSIVGSSKLIVENSFISYFKQDTAIYKGMKVIDEKLGGTTPLDIIVTFKNN
jgi:predicted RND superfamily exporter protein